VACEHELTDLKALLKAYQDVIHDLDLSRGALLSHSDPSTNAPAPAVKAVPASSPAPVDSGADRSTGRVVVPPAIRDTARPDPAGEWPRERQDRRSAEGALRTARQERAHLQRELAQIKASYARTVAAEADIADAARH
jgi:hypothetical protein